MVLVFSLLYLCAALLSIAAGALVIASLFIQGRAPQSTEMLGVHVAVGAGFLGVGILLLGIQRHVAGIGALAFGKNGEIARDLATHVSRLLGHLLAGGALLCAVLGLMTYAILARIDQGFAGTLSDNVSQTREEVPPRFSVGPTRNPTVSAVEEYESALSRRHARMLRDVAPRLPPLLSALIGR